MSLNVQLGILIFVHDELSVDCCCCVADNDGLDTEDEGEEVLQGEQSKQSEQGEQGVQCFYCFLLFARYVPNVAKSSI